MRWLKAACAASGQPRVMPRAGTRLRSRLVDLSRRWWEWLQKGKTYNKAVRPTRFGYMPQSTACGRIVTGLRAKGWGSVMYRETVRKKARDEDGEGIFLMVWTFVYASSNAGTENYPVDGG